MANSLGIDLGTNSLGLNLWDKYDADILPNQIKASVDTFRNGVAKGSYSTRESSLAAERTGFRGQRHRNRSSRARRQATLKHLILHGYCPLSMEALEKWRFDDEEKGYDRTFPDDEEFMRWIYLDFDGDGKADYSSVYELRNELMERDFDFTQPSERYKLGRALYHMAVHRGFKSNKGASAGEEEESTSESEIASEAKRAAKIKELMEEHQLKTIGQAFYFIESQLGQRVRNHPEYKVIRSQYKEEIIAIFERQFLPMGDDAFYLGLISQKKHEGTIFYKRPLASQKGKIAKCFLEPQKPRCYESHPEFEEFRALQFINNIRIRTDKNDEWQPLDENLRTLIYEKRFLNAVREYFKFQEIREFIEGQLNISLSKDAGTINYGDNTSIPGCPVTVRLNNLFGKDFTDIIATVNGRTYTVEDVWHICNTADDEEWLSEFAANILSLDEKATKQLITLWNKIPDGYSNLSLKAIRRINVMLRMGLRYDEAVMWAKVPEILGQQCFAEIKDSILDINATFFAEYNAAADTIRRENACIAQYFEEHPEEDYRCSNKKYKEMPVKVECFKAFLVKEFPDVRSYMWQKLYHHSDISFYPTPQISEDGNRYLADPVGGRMMPPAVKHTLFVLKHRINELIKQGEIDEHTRIVVETAREMCDANMKWALDTYNHRREEENKKIKDLIIELCPELQMPTDEDVRTARLLLEQGQRLGELDETIGRYYQMNVLAEKYRLWKEQDYLSIYTGNYIPFAKLFTDAYDIEHTLPISKSFDDSMTNKTICEAEYNRNPMLKGNKLPSECPNYNEFKVLPGYPKGCQPIRHSIVLQRWAEKVERLKAQVEYWDRRAKHAAELEVKNECLRQKYVYRMELDYWEGKLNRFFVTEIDDRFRNSQLNDTRIITRYAYHYLKSIFPKVFVERGETTAKFRRIFGIERDDEKNAQKPSEAAANEWHKDRSMHYHHAIDALVLSLMPSARLRDEILRLYYEAKEAKKLGNRAEEKRINAELRQKLYAIGVSVPEVQQAVQRIKAELIVRHEVKDNKMARNVRKVLKDGKDTGHRLTGDVAKGQLHKDSLYGAIMYPDLRYVKRELITSIKNLDSIVDPQVRWSIEEQMKRYGIKNLSSAADKPMWMMKKIIMDDGTVEVVLCDKDKHGRLLAPIRHVRCFTSVKTGNIIASIPTERRSKKACVNLSNREHKEHVYVEKGDYICCIIYRGTNEKGKAKHGYYFLTDMELSKLKRKNLQLAARYRSLKDYLMALPELEEMLIPIIGSKGTVYLKMNRLFVVLPGMMIRMKDDGTGKTTSERTFVVRNCNYAHKNGSIWIVHHSFANVSDNKNMNELSADKFMESYEIIE